MVAVDITFAIYQAVPAGSCVGLDTCMRDGG